MEITNDLTNVFNFKGSDGSGVSKHLPFDFIKSTDFNDLAEIFNKVSWASGYQALSDEGHLSYFYGNIVFRSIDTTISALLNTTYSTYGLNIIADTTDATTPNYIMDVSSYLLSIPLNDDLLFESFNPTVKMSIITDDSTLYPYRPQIHSFSYSDGKVLNFYLYNCYTGAVMNTTTFDALSDYALGIQIYGTRVVKVDDL
jgi:hypothetical protein